MTDKEQCKDCFFYKERSHRPKGLCRVDPPKFFAQAVPPDFQATTHGQSGTWPTVDADEWCGWFEKKEDCDCDVVILGFNQ